MAFTAKIADVIAADKTGLLAKHPSWQRVTLSDVARILNGAPFDASLFNTTSGMPLARIRDVLTGETSTYYTGEYEDAYLLERGDLLIGMDGDFNTGYWGEQRALLNQRVCKLAINSDFYDTKLLGLVLPGYLAAINANTPSITVKHLSSKTVGQIELPLPPRAEQTRIVEKLEELLGGLDAAVAELKTAQRKLASLRQSLLKSAVEGALTAPWRTAHAPTESGAQLLRRILAERRARWEARQRAKFAQAGKAPPKGWQAKYPEPVAPETRDLEALPQGWVWATIDQLAQVGTGVTPLRSKRVYFDGGSIPWTTSGALNDGLVTSAAEHVTQLALDECRLEIFPAGSLLVAMYGEGKTRGKCAELAFPSTINQAIAALVFEETAAAVRSHVKTALLDAYEAMRKQASGGVQPNLNLQIVKARCVPLPSLEEQAEIAEQLTTALAAIQDQEAAVAHGLHQAAAQRRNILKAA
ncbi:MAG: restriction endonuclease subunit S, partial [Proteobacteria bacterium]|nr:restriction endonuclease subunit S [Pseudomonadota bacterium]